VLRAYGDRCVPCLVKLHVRLRPVAAGINAAHIRWSTFDGPDAVTNGPVRRAFHNKVFDPSRLRWRRVRVSAEVNEDKADMLLRPRPPA